MFANGPKLVTQGLAFLVDAADPTSYPGSGTTWTDVVSRVTGSISGSVSYTSSFYGGFNFTGPTASVRFDGTNIANYGSGSFTVELAFRPARIEGIHYLISKNSGSFPSWGVYLSGSGGSGKLFSEFRISSTVSCSISSSTTFVTGSNYQVDVRILPASSASGFYVDGVGIGGGLGNGGGSLTSTGSLFVGNFAPSSSQAFSGSIFASKIYSVNTLLQPPQNYNAVASRLSKPPLTLPLPTFELLVVAGGGSGGNTRGGGGGAGGLQYVPSFIPSAGTTLVVVGNSGSNSNGQNSVFGTTTSIGGGKGGNFGINVGANGGSGGGGGGVSVPVSGGLGTLGQGNNGGNCPGGSDPAGGGGGAGQAGRDGTGIGGNGGSGSFIDSFSIIGGSPAGWFAGGGGGAGNSGNGTGAPGGGGNVNQTGSINTGGGGGGGNSTSGAAGGSGIVAIRYNGAPIALGGEITQSGGYTYHVYRTVGTSSFTVF